MPAVPILIAAAGAYFGARWLVRKLERQAEAARAAAEELQRRAAEPRPPRDLGALVLDPESGAYVPRSNP